MSEAMNEEEIDRALEQRGGWRREGDFLCREFSFADFKQAMIFLNALALEAEALNHHPEIGNLYNKVRLRLQTHDAGNRISARDFELAARVDALWGGA